MPADIKIYYQTNDIDGTVARTVMERLHRNYAQCVESVLGETESLGSQCRIQLVAVEDKINSLGYPRLLVCVEARGVVWKDVDKRRMLEQRLAEHVRDVLQDRKVKITEFGEVIEVSCAPHQFTPVSRVGPVLA